jgi:Cu/Ag efflux pump CusA
VATRNSVPVCVRDVAEIRVGPRFRREVASRDGQQAVSVTAEKQYGGDTLSAIANLRARPDRIAGQLPDGVAIGPFYDQSTLIRSSLDHVQASMLIGAALIVALMLCFMWDLRGALVASLTIPFSMLIALILMDLGGVTPTVMSIGGLAIGIGTTANGSITMVEHIYRVQREGAGCAARGRRPVRAAHLEQARRDAGRRRGRALGQALRPRPGPAERAHR